MKAIDPWRWEAYDRARRQGHNQAAACRLSGVSPASAERWERERRAERQGGTSERRSSAWAWLEWRAMVGDEQADKVGAKALAKASA